MDAGPTSSCLEGLRWPGGLLLALVLGALVSCGPGDSGAGESAFEEAIRSGEWAVGHGLSFEAPPPEGEAIFFFLIDQRTADGVCPQDVELGQGTVTMRGAFSSSAPGAYHLVPSEELEPGEAVLQVVEVIDGHAGRRLWAVNGTVTLGERAEDGSFALGIDAEFAEGAEIECGVWSGSDVTLCACEDREGEPFECEGQGCCWADAPTIPFSFVSQSNRCPGVCAFTSDEWAQYCPEPVDPN